MKCSRGEGSTRGCGKLCIRPSSFGRKAVIRHLKIELLSLPEREAARVLFR